MMLCLLLLINNQRRPHVLMSHDKSLKNGGTDKSYSPFLGLPIIKRYIKALSLYNPQNLSSLEKA
ncbi:hypothetical protein NC653_002327 [Populus alba x Populus x berolinensis]|uniref:Uncharacterized protein n=1 Tax=Populus alba x Populus x berolinensis TaxID=444605 RepID=A0AAD6RNF2_9ROSI|nr:hypothetical protein NC653_002327 [Populus alba x Populus x berolinensis]